MKLRKFEGSTEEEARSKVFKELGDDAIILSVSKIQQRGFFGFFKKQKYEVTAFFDEKNSVAQAKQKVTPSVASAEPVANNHDAIVKDFKIQEQQVKISNLEEKLTSTEELLSKYLSQPKKQEKSSPVDFSNPIVQMICQSLRTNGVEESIIEELLSDLDDKFETNDNTNINFLVKIVYNRIINILKLPEPIQTDRKTDGLAKVTIFMGPTGVGKTTTIAKLSSYFMLAKQKKVGLITADTYRVAAVEQLKTYADILGISVFVVYRPEDLENCIEKARQTNDIVFVDTAGRSHKNAESLRDLELILDKLPYAERFLVLSTTTKYDDLLKIIKVYSDITDYKIIFTKLDETSSMGSILNIARVTGRPLSYTTDGQEVPDDIRVAQPDVIAKSLLGSNDV